MGSVGRHIRRCSECHVVASRSQRDLSGLCRDGRLKVETAISVAVGIAGNQRDVPTGGRLDNTGRRQVSIERFDMHVAEQVRQVADDQPVVTAADDFVNNHIARHAVRQRERFRIRFEAVRSPHTSRRCDVQIGGHDIGGFIG